MWLLLEEKGLDSLGADLCILPAISCSTRYLNLCASVFFFSSLFFLKSYESWAEYIVWVFSFSVFFLNWLVKFTFNPFSEKWINQTHTVLSIIYLLFNLSVSLVIGWSVCVSVKAACNFKSLVLSRCVRVIVFVIVLYFFPTSLFTVWVCVMLIQNHLDSMQVFQNCFYWYFFTPFPVLSIWYTLLTCSLWSRISDNLTTVVDHDASFNWFEVVVNK